MLFSVSRANSLSIRILDHLQVGVVESSSPTGRERECRRSFSSSDTGECDGLPNNRIRFGGGEGTDGPNCQGEIRRDYRGSVKVAVGIRLVNDGTSHLETSVIRKKVSKRELGHSHTSIIGRGGLHYQSED